MMISMIWMTLRSLKVPLLIFISLMTILMMVLPLWHRICPFVVVNVDVAVDVVVLVVVVLVMLFDDFDHFLPDVVVGSEKTDVDEKKVVLDVLQDVV